MTNEQIETFLAVVSQGSISAAADALFISQSAASNRIQLLEQELGAELLLRRRGQRNVELTSFGQSFVPVANQWASLWTDTQNLKTLADVQTLNIASVDAVNNFTFLPLYHQHIETYPNVKLTINTHHSNEIHGLVENRAADIGFVYSQIRYPNIISRPIYRELMYLLCHRDSDYHDKMELDRLRSEDEVFLSWGAEYRVWHDRHWNPERHYLLTVNTGSMLQHYLHKPGRWAIAPMSVVQALKSNSDLTYYTLQEPPPSRICYELTSRYPRASHVEAIKLFQQELDTYIAADKDICTFEPWMLEVQSVPK